GRGGGEVRVMTVHGAKGLEAPIVILPDTTSRADDQGGHLIETGDGGFVWAPRKADDCPFSAAARAWRLGAVERESARLLYVALTRARDRLIVAGVKSQAKRFERSWREYVETAFGELEAHPFALEGGGEGRRYGPDPVPAVAAAPPAAPAPPLPEWTFGLAPAEPDNAAWVSPSSAAEGAGPPAPSPLATVNGLGRYRRGDLIHKLLQLLPDVVPARRAAAARTILGRERDLTDPQRAEMAGAALTVLADPRFAAVFGEGSKAEVALAGAVGGLPLSGRVDRLVVSADRVLVVDYKTNRPPPARIEDADGAYVTQMALYAALLRQIFPDRQIAAALLWTDGPSLMAVPDAMMEEALARL
ncbi:MAG: PD-(D/E)XK nuclease family protein, partial [Caulobacteraceae bacterium]